MPDVMSVLKAEITRLARKEIKDELKSVKKASAEQRKSIVELRREVLALQKGMGRLQKEIDKLQPEEEETSEGWMSGKGVLAMRKRLGITQMDLVELAGVSHQSIVRWEQTEGKIKFKSGETLAVLKEIKAMTKTEAWAKLGKEK